MHARGAAARLAARWARGYSSATAADSSSGSTGRRLAYAAVAGTAAVAAGTYSDEPQISQLSFAASAAATPLLRLVDGASSAAPPRRRRLGVSRAPLRDQRGATRCDATRAQTVLWGRVVSNPLGLAAGFDKDAEAVEALHGLGFGLVEIGSVTPRSQPGNPKPRVFRLPDARACINRYGFNSDGAARVAARLLERHKRRDEQALHGGGSAASAALLGVNLGKNKETADAAADYEKGVAALGRFADYIVVNVSSPNTPGLRALQGRAELEALLKRAARAALAAPGVLPPPLVLKIAPDVSEADMRDIAAVALKLKLDGLIVSNTTIERPPEVAALPHGTETGGLSGAPLRDRSTAVLRRMAELTRGQITLIGAGGVSSGADAYAKIRAGASAVQLYTAFAYDGPPLVPRVKAELAVALRADGFTSVEEAVGADVPEMARARRRARK